VANLKLYLQLLERGQPERKGTYLETLNREADRLRRLIDGFLEIAQIDAGATSIKPTNVNLNTLLDDLYEDRWPTANQRGLVVELQPAPDLPQVSTDRTWIAQAVSNLLDNALNYTPAGGQITLATAVRELDEQLWATVSVCDTGPGIAADELPHVFERFYRGEAARNFKLPGAGLGLSISHEIVRRLQGRLTVDSKLGHGATFTVWLRIPPTITGLD
jgi:two-component system sensor histidine kinase BaeS